MVPANPLHQQSIWLDMTQLSWPIKFCLSSTIISSSVLNDVWCSLYLYMMQSLWMSFLKTRRWSMNNFSVVMITLISLSMGNLVLARFSGVLRVLAKCTQCPADASMHRYYCQYDWHSVTWHIFPKITVHEATLYLKVDGWINHWDNGAGHVSVNHGSDNAWYADIF